jgi:hypothetical protein
MERDLLEIKGLLLKGELQIIIRFSEEGFEVIQTQVRARIGLGNN